MTLKRIIARKLRGQQRIISKIFIGRYKTSAFTDLDSALRHQESINRHLDSEIKNFISKNARLFLKGIFKGNPIKRQKVDIRENGDYTEIKKTVYFRTIPNLNIEK
jgi:hypothetical protein